MKTNLCRWAGAVLLALMLGSAGAAQVEKSERLVNVHDLTTTVAVGDYYLKQESILAARDFLRRLGVEQNLGGSWNPSNDHWKQAEDAIVSRLMGSAKRDFSSLEWLSEEWSRLNQAEFTEQDLDGLLTHFGTMAGRKQAMIVDHSIAFHVISALALGGKIQHSLPGIEADRKRMQDLYEIEEREMRFDTEAHQDGNRFAMSATGKKYFVNAVLKVTGMVSQRLSRTAADLPRRIDPAATEIEAALEGFRKSGRA
ncbi:MAG: hypothetical protein IT532_03080 [Burkholderiales bacterium]|nr:hypothetical protein [Burkholderiales bacterium]